MLLKYNHNKGLKFPVNYRWQPPARGKWKLTSYGKDKYQTLYRYRVPGPYLYDSNSCGWRVPYIFKYTWNNRLWWVRARHYKLTDVS